EVAVERDVRCELERELCSHHRSVVGRQRRARTPAEEITERHIADVRRELNHLIRRFVDHTQPTLRAQRHGGRDERDDCRDSAGSYTHRVPPVRDVMRAHLAPKARVIPDFRALALPHCYNGTCARNGQTLRARCCPRVETKLSTHCVERGGTTFQLMMAFQTIGNS